MDAAEVPDVVGRVTEVEAEVLPEVRQEVEPEPGPSQPEDERAGESERDEQLGPAASMVDQAPREKQDRKEEGVQT